ncbi:LOW QUALITY PROTEIN: pentatricopeptide repeat-containing protein At2g13600-like [Diospyros lotus]|uniref:LOW QUALITY PROTEIN: pentatricopeptide repeat-containing protein At2g13600-like n=1 Tax=Diospyros lotus TaxID=55363 RepID=UPI00225A0FE1|nr:LOW QUALITY PROTEIN: pentatricopeptide repeat-containing protein At2g13600-like [Diospyros lotus]
MMRKSRYSHPGSVADLVRRRQLRSDRRGISTPLKYDDPFNNPLVEVGKGNSAIDMYGKSYHLAPVTLTKEQQASHEKKRSPAYQWKRPSVFLREGDPVPPDVDPDTITASGIDEDLAQTNVYQKHGVPFHIQAEHEALQRRLEALQSEHKFQKLVMYNLYANRSYMELSQKYYEAMIACAASRSISIARKLHAQLIRSGFMTEAEQLFEQMPERDIVSWNSMMSGYFDNGLYEDSLKAFALMIQDRYPLRDILSFSCAIKSCARLGYQDLAFQLHALAEKFDFGRDVSIRSSIIDMYIKCGELKLAEHVFSSISSPNLFCLNSMVYAYSKLYGIESALSLFNQMHEHDAVSWDTIISILSEQEYEVHALNMFVEMWKQGLQPNSLTYASVLSACASIHDLGWGMHVHARIIQREPNRDMHVASGLINMYAKCGCLESAVQIFSDLTEHSVVSWTSLIAGVAWSGHNEEALVLFEKMRKFPVALDEFTVSTVLGVCSRLKEICLGEQLHTHAIKTGMDSYVPLGNSLVTMYAKCDNVQSAKRAFDLMPIRDTISWTMTATMVAQTGDVQEAFEYFRKMPKRNVITWNSMLSTYVNQGLWEEGLRLYILMLREGVKPDWVTFSILTSVCADSAVLKLGSQVVAQTEKLGFAFDVSIANSVITMYSRCGRIGEARKVFDSLVVKNLISWNSIMDGYAQSGQGSKVLEIFENMLTMGCRPDNISYVSVLSGCSHSGLLSKGQHYFKIMTKEHGITPTSVHFACMIDLLGRAGLLDQAKDLIDDMPMEPNADVWRSLLGACRVHANAKLAEIAVKNLIELDAENSGSYVLLANIYSDCGDLDGVLNMRKFMKERRIRKNPGCSWVEIGDGVHVFTVDNTNHPQIKDIYTILKDIMKNMKDTVSFYE